jgi:hypothetical protein
VLFYTQLVLQITTFTNKRLTDIRVRIHTNYLSRIYDQVLRCTKFMQDYQKCVRAIKINNKKNYILNVDSVILEIDSCFVKTRCPIIPYTSIRNEKLTSCNAELQSRVRNKYFTPLTPRWLHILPNWLQIDQDFRFDHDFQSKRTMAAMKIMNAPRHSNL